MSNLVGDFKANPKDFYRYMNSQKKVVQGIPPLNKRNGSGITQSESKTVTEFNDQFTDMLTKSLHSEVPLLNKSAPSCEILLLLKKE